MTEVAGAGLLALAREQRNAGRLDDAERACRSALEAAGDDAEAHRLLATILHAAGHSDDALAAFAEARRLDPRNAKVEKQLAVALAEQGHLEEAELADRRAIELRPDYSAAHAHLASLKRFESADDPDLAALEALRDDDGLDDADRSVLLFALAKAYEELGEYERAFHELRTANELRRGLFDYDVARDLRFFERIAAVFNDVLFASFAGAGSASQVPIVIIGMPRSGTTLVEQILSSHPEVHGGGELSDVREVALAVTLLGGTGFPEGVPQLRREDVARLGDGYLSRLQHLAPGAARVTDKSLQGFAYIGFAHLILPGARFVHCARDPIDTCLSCYALDLQDVPFANDLFELGRYYRGYVQLMEHWRRLLRPGLILDVPYEGLVADLETWARRLVDHCGLTWDDACLRFHETQRVIRTASFAQVRRPAYRTSVGRARRFAAHLGPLCEALEAKG